MYKLILILSIVFSLIACSEEIDTDLTKKQPEDTECKPFVDLYFTNRDSLKRDPVSINEVSLDGQCLIINLSYGGGCADHQIDLALNHPSCATPPLPPPTFEIRHDSKEDLCEAWITQTLYYDLSGLSAQKGEEILIALHANGYNNSYYHEELTIRIE